MHSCYDLCFFLIVVIFNSQYEQYLNGKKCITFQFMYIEKSRLKYSIIYNITML